MSSDYIIEGFETQRFERLIASTSLDYKHQFIGTLHAMNSRS